MIEFLKSSGARFVEYRYFLLSVWPKASTQFLGYCIFHCGSDKSCTCDFQDIASFVALRSHGGRQQNECESEPGGFHLELASPLNSERNGESLCRRRRCV